MRIWKPAIILLLCLVVAGATACSPGGDQETEQLVEVKRGDLTVSVSGSGSIVVSDEANLAFGTSGKIHKIYAEEGDKVKKGESLAQLDSGSLELAVAQAKASLKQAEYNLDETKEPYSEDDIDSAERGVGLAEDYLNYAKWMLDQAEETQEDAEDYLHYVERLPYDPEEFDAAQEKIAEAEAQLKQAEAQLDQAEAAVEQWRIEISRAEADLTNAKLKLEDMLDGPDEGAVEAAEAQFEAATKAVAEVQKQLDEAIIIAPFDGTISRVEAKAGEFLSPAAYTGRIIVEIVDRKHMELIALVAWNHVEMHVRDHLVGDRPIVLQHVHAGTASG